jgi:subtilase family serine protease
MREKSFFIRVAQWTVAIALAALSIPAQAQNAGTQALQNSAPAAISNLSATGRLAATTRLNLSIGLPLRNESALADLLHQLYDPASPNYRHYLTPGQFAEQFAPSSSDYRSVANFFGTNGFTVVEHPSRMVLDVSGRVPDVERVFHLTMQTYEHPTEHRTFFGPDRAPSLNLSVPILHISGLDNYALKRSKIVREKAVKRQANTIGQAKVPNQTGSGPDDDYMGNDFRAAYIPGVSLAGKGQTVGLVEFDTYYPDDVSYYESLNGLSVPLITVPIDGGVTNQGAGNDEVSLDIDVSMSIAPALDQIVLYTASTNAPWEDVLDAMASDSVNFPKQFSCSWSDDTAGDPDLTAENIFKQMMAQGQSFYQAAGDGDAFVGGIPFPEESSNIVQVGGTTLTTTGPGGQWVYETTWDWGGEVGGDSSIGSGGGISENFGIPPWQQGISMAANEGSTTMRNTPDVAMTADNIFIEGDDGNDETIGGTSAAAPAWAALTALANQQASAYGRGPVGFANPLIYAAGKSATYSSDFYDITTGNNFWALSLTGFPAVSGYDLCTGWGTPAGDNLIDLLAGVGDPLAVSPGKGFVAFGASGGAFTATAMTFSLTNSSASSLNWSIINTSSWLTASSSGGVLPAHSTTQATVSLNAAAYALAAGTYSAGVLFSNTTSHAVRTREFVLVAGQNLIQNGDFEYVSTPFDQLPALSFWAQTGGIGFFDEVPYPTYNYDWVDDGTYTGYDPYSGTQFLVFGTAGTIGNISQNIATVPGQSYMLSFAVADPYGGKTERFFVNWNNNTIYSETNSPAYDWTLRTFILIATSTNTLLQFGSRNDNAFGFDALDDVTLMAIASAPSINLSISMAGAGAVILAWNSSSGGVYQVQSSTNLLSTNWSSLSTNTATGPTLSFTNNIGPGPRRFYRVLQQ